ncbi:helix-hairpin-helix domain-containing protein [Anatilimnocola floriformis]|uniref:helix-hairpin-helix domain-containing protein n=1 Tax=Anatilimnocola floriformis TaxID=2948575 RepID=UPI0020C2BB4B|nr:hypothetical protein [Anatilimnocola floriformis]
MSRPTYPTRLRDHLGNEVAIPAKPFATGGEGAVFDVVGRPDLVAKLYSKPQSKERCDKLRAMTKAWNTDLQKIAAWPTATLNNGNPTAVAGILMPRIANHKEIHNLYSVAQRKKDFPDKDWGFLLHTARNCAIAFESIHSHGHVVGDVNQKNVMVSEKGIVALVDCDSFQVKEGNRIFRCGVGVPEYTPPELHGRKFTEVDRDANHDTFGLAVMVFHLLMMGRHPFAGVPQVNVDIPIEKAIQDGLYAYARNASKLKPPPHVPPLAMLNAPVRDLFERAFASHQRPTASEWRHALDASLNGLQRCKNDPKHSFPAGTNCPWCQLITVSRLMFFVPSQGVAGATLQFEDIQKLVIKLTSMQLVFSSLKRPRPRLAVQIKLPASLRSIPKPILLTHPLPPAAVQQPVLLPLPPQPTPLAEPILRLLPGSPALPTAPRLRPHPPAPEKLPLPRLHEKPSPPVYPPPAPVPASSEPFLATLSLAGALAGVPIFLFAKPVGLMMMLAFGMWWLVMKVTHGLRRAMLLKSLKTEYKAECAHIDFGYAEQLKLIENANRKILDAWNTANATKAHVHAQLCKVVDAENRVRLAPWETIKVSIEAEHARITQGIIQANRRVLLDWEAQKEAIRTAYVQACGRVELENQQRTVAWEAVTASRQLEYRQKCAVVDAENRQTTAAWEAANAPWVDEQKRWRDRKSFAELEIKRLEDELLAQRSMSVSRFQQRKVEIERVLKSHEGARQDYERDLRLAESNSKMVQLDEHLDKSLIRRAKLKGINSGCVLSLASFGIETAKDVPRLKDLKVPKIGKVLSQRLFEWRDKLASTFRPQQGLPESERKRVGSRYAPLLLPLTQALQSAIEDLNVIEASHRAAEAKRMEAIAAAVQDLAVAEATVKVMSVV